MEAALCQTAHAARVMKLHRSAAHGMHGLHDAPGLRSSSPPQGGQKSLQRWWRWHTRSWSSAGSSGSAAAGMRSSSSMSMNTMHVLWRVASTLACPALSEINHPDCIS